MLAESPHQKPDVSGPQGDSAAPRPQQTTPGSRDSFEKKFAEDLRMEIELAEKLFDPQKPFDLRTINTYRLEKFVRDLSSRLYHGQNPKERPFCVENLITIAALFEKTKRHYLAAQTFCEAALKAKENSAEEKIAYDGFLRCANVMPSRLREDLFLYAERRASQNASLASGASKAANPPRPQKPPTPTP